MQSSPCSTATLPPNSTNPNPEPGQFVERAYRGLTIAAMLILLYSIWLFR